MFKTYIFDIFSTHSFPVGKSVLQNTAEDKVVGPPKMAQALLSTSFMRPCFVVEVTIESIAAFEHGFVHVISW